MESKKIRYSVIETYDIDGNTAVCIEGDGYGLFNGVIVNAGKYTVISVGIGRNVNNQEMTDLLIEGKFTDKVIEI